MGENISPVKKQQRTNRTLPNFGEAQDCREKVPPQRLPLVYQPGPAGMRSSPNPTGLEIARNRIAPGCPISDFLGSPEHFSITHFPEFLEEIDFFNSHPCYRQLT
jgi:hypothetical protein